MTGEARFAPDAGFLRYEETGCLAFGDFRSQAQRVYRYRIDGDSTFSVFFADGAFFHHATFTDGLAWVAHDCPPDDYRGRYRMTAADGWMLSWRVRGPRKDLVIGTRFFRSIGG